MESYKTVDEFPEQEKEILHWTVFCPEADRLADADLSAWTIPPLRAPHFAVRACSFWPEKKSCDQKCVTR